MFSCKVVTLVILTFNSCNGINAYNASLSTTPSSDTETTISTTSFTSSISSIQEEIKSISQHDQLSFQEITNIVVIILLSVIILLCIILIFVMINKSNTKHKIFSKLMDLHNHSQFHHIDSQATPATIYTIDRRGTNTSQGTHDSQIPVGRSHSNSLVTPIAMGPNGPIHYLVTTGASGLPIIPSARLEPDVTRHLSVTNSVPNSAHDELKGVSHNIPIMKFKSNSKLYKMEGQSLNNSVVKNLDGNELSEPTDKSDAMYDNPNDGPNPMMNGTLFGHIHGYGIAIPPQDTEIAQMAMPPQMQYSDNEMEEEKMDELPVDSPPTKGGSHKMSLHLPRLPSHLTVNTPSCVSMTLPKLPSAHSNHMDIPELPNGSTTLYHINTKVIQEKILNEQKRIETVIDLDQNTRDVHVKNQDETEKNHCDIKEIVVSENDGQDSEEMEFVGDISFDGMPVTIQGRSAKASPVTINVN